MSEISISDSIVELSSANPLVSHSRSISTFKPSISDFGFFNTYSDDLVTKHTPQPKLRDLRILVESK